MEILLVEDSLPAAKLAIRSLQKNGFKHRMSWMSDGQDAYDFLFRQRQFAQAPEPDLVLLDLNLPRMHGKELLAAIRNSDHLKSVPVVIMTSESEEFQAEDFKDQGVNSFMVKPVNVEKFLNVVDELEDCWKADMIVPGAQ